MKLIGPISQLITFSDAPLKGSLKENQLSIIQDAGIIFNGEKIIEVGEFESLAKNKVDLVLELTGSMVGFPGFIDCHTHMIWGGSRAGDFEKRNSGVSYQQILSEGGGIKDTVSKTRAASDSELATLLTSRALRHLKDGITTVEVKTGYGLSEEEELRMLNIINLVDQQIDTTIIPTFLGAHVCPTGFEKTEYLNMLLDKVVPEIKLNRLARRADIFIEPEAFHAEIADRYVGKLREQGFDLTVHGGQFTKEGVHIAIKHNSKSVDHLENIGQKEIDMIAASNTIAVALPGASIGLGEPFTPARKLLDGGASLAIATDWNPGSAPQGDLISQASLLATNEKLSAAEVFAGITYRAATALGLEDRGRVKNGKVADFVFYDTDDYREVLYNMGRLKPAQVYKNGELK